MNWGKILTAAIPAIVQGGASLLGSSISQDQQTEQLELQKEAQREQTLLELKLAALKAQYAGGGSGGGSGVNPNKLTRAQHVAAVAGQGDAERQAIQNLLSSLQTGYSLGARG